MLVAPFLRRWQSIAPKTAQANKIEKAKCCIQITHRPCNHRQTPRYSLASIITAFQGETTLPSLQCSPLAHKSPQICPAKFVKLGVGIQKINAQTSQKFSAAKRNISNKPPFCEVQYMIMDSHTFTPVIEWCNLQRESLSNC